MSGSDQPADSDGDVLTLQEAADRLKVHYMTAYRWVRQGNLPAFKAGGRLRVRVADIESFLEQRSVDVVLPSPERGRRDWGLHVERLLDHLLAGQAADAVALVRKVVADGAPVGDVYLHLLTPAMHRVGEYWAQGRISVAEEHRATEICRAVVARLGVSFRRRGPSSATVVTLTPPGERHDVGSAMVADFLRGAGFEVHHLGADVPLDDLRLFVEVVEADAICVSVTAPDTEQEVLRALVVAAEEGGSLVAVMGGQGVTAERAEQAGALHVDDLSAIARRLLEALHDRRTS